MKIAIIGSRGYPYVYGGYETFIAELAPRLVERGHTVTIYCHRGLYKERPILVNGVHLKYIPSINTKILSQISNSFLSTLHVIFTTNDIVFYVNSANGPFGILPRLFGKRTIINVDGVEWLRPKWAGFGSKYFHFASMLATKLCNLVVTDSDRMAGIYRTEFNAESIMIAYGANLISSHKPDLLQRNGLIPGDYYLVVGRLVPDNNALLIVQEFQLSSTKRKLIVVGDVPYKDEYARYVTQVRDPRIIFTGYIRNTELLNELYANSYAYIHGHGYGGTNPALLTALGAGCCVLAFDNVFNREVLEDEEYGLYFNKEPQSLSRLIDFIDRHPAALHAFRSKSRDRIAEFYTWDRITDQYEIIFDAVLNKTKEDN